MKKTHAVRGKNIYINTTKTSALCGCHYHFTVQDRQGKNTQAFSVALNKTTTHVIYG